MIGACAGTLRCAYIKILFTRSRASAPPRNRSAHRIEGAGSPRSYRNHTLLYPVSGAHPCSTPPTTFPVSRILAPAAVSWPPRGDCRPARCNARLDRRDRNRRGRGQHGDCRSGSADISPRGRQRHGVRRASGSGGVRLGRTDGARHRGARATLAVSGLLRNISQRCAPLIVFAGFSWQPLAVITSWIVLSCAGEYTVAAQRLASTARQYSKNATS